MNGSETVKKGQMLIVQGQQPRYIYFLHNGALEILSASNEYDGLDAEIIASKSKRIGIIKGEGAVVGLSVSLSEPSRKSIRAIEDSSVSKYAITGGINQLASENPAVIINLLNLLFKNIESAISDANRASKLYLNLNRIGDNISLMSRVMTKRQIPEKLKNKADNLYSIFISNGGDFKTVFDASFLISDNSAYLKKKYSFPGLPLESLVDVKQAGFIRKFLRIDKKFFAELIKQDPSIGISMAELVLDNYIKVLDRLCSVTDEIDQILKVMFGSEQSWSNYLVEGGGFDEWTASGRIEDEFIKNFLNLIKKINSFYEEITGRRLVDVYEGPRKIHKYFISRGESAGPAVEDSIQTAAPVSSADDDLKTTYKKTGTAKFYKNSLKQIFEFTLIDKEFQKTFLKAINDFKNMKDPFDTEQEGRKVRRGVSKLYWDLYKQTFLRAQKESSLPHPVRLMLRYGFLDNAFLEEEQIEILHDLSLNREDETGDIPILFEEEFLKNIYNGAENPSINEMGMSYEAFLSEQEKHGKKEDETPKGESDYVKKALYEIDHRVFNTVAICSGSTASAFPILTSLIMKGDPRKYFIDKKKLHAKIKELIDIDYSAFYRETAIDMGGVKELIEEEVLPNFILLPSIGQKAMLWQDIDGKNRKSRGRIVLPVFFMGDIVKSLAYTFACFRWELNRTIKGGLWADPVEGGITGVYFDYVNFYKKNPKLSVEAKDKITEKFRSLRTNRDRFADDYILWTLYEKDGVMRMNSVTREMFYRYIPFRKDIRAKLETMPAFTETATRYKNVQSRNIAGYERRYKKYTDSSGNLPDKLREFMNYLNM